MGSRMTQKQGLMGVFAYLDDLLAAIEALKEKNLRIHTVYSPVARHEIREALALKPSPIRYLTLCGGVLGIVTGVSLAAFTAVQWKFIVGGKPIVAFIPYVIVAFEFCILLSISFNLAGMLIKGRLPKITLPDHYDARFTEDRFGVFVLCSENEREEVARILTEAGVEEVHDAKG